MASPSSHITFPRCLKTKKLYKGAFSNFFFFSSPFIRILTFSCTWRAVLPCPSNAQLKLAEQVGSGSCVFQGWCPPPWLGEESLEQVFSVWWDLLHDARGLRWRSEQLGCLLWGSAIGVRASAGQCLELGGFLSHIWPLQSCRPSRAPLSLLAVPSSVFLTRVRFFFCSAQGKSEVLLRFVGTGQILGACCCGQSAGWWDRGGQRMLSCWVY